MLASKLSSDKVGSPRYPVQEDKVFVKYNFLNSQGKLLKTECNPSHICFEVTYKLTEDGKSVDEVGIDFDHNQMKQGVWYKVQILNETRGFMINNDGELLQVRYSE